MCVQSEKAPSKRTPRARRDVKRAFQLVSCDRMGPMTPPALGGFFLVGKCVDQQTRWKQVFLMKSKKDAIYTLRLFVQALVIPTGLRLERLRTDKGGQFTGGEYRQYCLDIGVKQEIAAVNTPQQIGPTSEAGGRWPTSYAACSKILVFRICPPKNQK